MAAGPSVELDVVRVTVGPNHCPVDKGIDLTVEFSVSADVAGYWSFQASLWALSSQLEQSEGCIGALGMTRISVCCALRGCSSL